MSPAPSPTPAPARSPASAAAGAAAAAQPPPSPAALRLFSAPSKDNLSRLFHWIDRAGNGIISLIEFLDATDAAGGGVALALGDAEQEALFEGICEGAASVDEATWCARLEGRATAPFCDWMARALAQLPESAALVAAAEAAPLSDAALTSLFRWVDGNRDGRVTSGEFTTACRNGLGASGPLPLSARVLVALFRSVDRDRQGWVDEATWVARLRESDNAAFKTWAAAVTAELARAGRE